MALNFYHFTLLSPFGTCQTGLGKDNPNLLGPSDFTSRPEILSAISQDARWAPTLANRISWAKLLGVPPTGFFPPQRKGEGDLLIARRSSTDR